MIKAPWHKWFAWHPVRTNYHGWKWLRTVYRRQRYTPMIPFHGAEPYWEYGLYTRKADLISDREREQLEEMRQIYIRRFGHDPDTKQ